MGTNKVYKANQPRLRCNLPDSRQKPSDSEPAASHPWTSFTFTHQTQPVLLPLFDYGLVPGYAGAVETTSTSSNQQDVSVAIRLANESVRILQTLHFYFDKEHLGEDDRLHIHFFANVDPDSGLLRCSGKVLMPEEWNRRHEPTAYLLKEGVIVSCKLGRRNGIAFLFKADWRLLMEYICGRDWTPMEARAFQNVVGDGPESSSFVEWSTFPEALDNVLKNYYLRRLNGQASVTLRRRAITFSSSASGSSGSKLEKSGAQFR
ncbi:hypothetical protein PENSPDRAFT_658659 [Peniophora sp. CONT]|nr:hypothetical protein PENSPDRAFT_658659 [Peniophora sp. CONT]